ncbi:MAG: ATP-binding cassette domain-containing protein, partial [Deltaproteobacteria bacterium]
KYPDGNRGLADIDLQVAAGQTLGIVGPIGSGKTTLVRALLRLVDVPVGSTFVGGHDVTTLTLHSLRGAFGYVPQNPSLFSKSIAQNVAFGQPDSTSEQILAALEQANLSMDLAALPQGLETPVGERGLTLSGGQKQRCAMARALLLDPPILILDDSLSAVDTETEAQILRTLRRLRRGRTTLIVGHRITAVQEADSIIVLDAGRIVERGHHGALVQLWPYMAHHRLSLFASLLLYPLNALCVVLPPYLLKQILDTAIPQGDMPRLYLLGGLYLGALVCEYATGFGAELVMSVLGQRAMQKLRQDLFDHVQRLPIAYFERNPIGRILTRLTTDVEALGDVFATGAVTIIADLLTVVAVVSMMLYLNVRMTLVAFCVVPPLVGLAVLFQGYAREAF